ncbi:hypothetical protein BAE30_09685 [Acidithiobacillus caldus]|uniref:Uncharacterized protein n=1 Tax=Acidithiobacillus caldus TaxID=33059 RepID=A0A1E7YUG2_9PROT|nr:hypothetical protein BAE30_09685 [Acidithiobacillus caldus]
MRSYIHPRLRRDLIAEEWRQDPESRNHRVSAFLEEASLTDLVRIGLRRASRIHTLPPYEPFAISITPAAQEKLLRLEAEMGKQISISAIVQEILKGE